MRQLTSLVSIIAISGFLALANMPVQAKCTGLELAYDDGTCEFYPEINETQYFRTGFLLSWFGLSGDYLVETVRIYWGPRAIGTDFAGVIKLRDWDPVARKTVYVVTAASFSNPTPDTWQDYDVSGVYFFSDCFFVELWQTSGYGYIGADTDLPGSGSCQHSTDFGETWYVFPHWPWEVDFMIRVRVTRAITVDINPDIFELKGKGKWITAYIQLPEGYDAEDIDATTILLNETIQPVLDAKYDFVTDSSEYLVDHNEDGILERMVKFGRAEVMALLSVGEATLTISGEVNGILFEGSDTIRVIDE